ncbi:uncharacterized protein [Dermacentor albipictus]|uniref:uncharacterized protein isoform X2 n=1 Tax=Dermacentor albipictus TaxID=60249 RepID=UPI0038FC81CA
MRTTTTSLRPARRQAPLLPLLLLGLLLVVPASRASEPVDPMDAYLRAQPPELTRPKAAKGRGFAAAESISSPSHKLQLPESEERNTDDLPYGTRLKPPRPYGFIVAAPPATTTQPRLVEATRSTTTVRPRALARPTASARTPAVRGGGPQRRRLVPDDLVGPKKFRTTQQSTRPTVPPLSAPPQTKFRTPTKVTLTTPRPTVPPSSKVKGALRSRKPFGSAKSPLKTSVPPPASSKNGTRAAVNESSGSGNGTTPGPKAQASFFFTNVGPNHFEYRGVFDQNAVPISFHENPETLYQLIPQLPRLFEDPFSAPRGPAAQLLLQPPPKLTEPPAPPPPPPLTLLQPVVNFIEDPVPPPTAVVEHVPPPPPPPPPPAPRPQARLRPGGFPKYDYIRGPQYPKIFKFNDERISILEFERIKREGRFTKRRGDALDPDRVPRNNFLIFHGGLFKAPREQEYGNLVAPPPPRSEPVFAPYKVPEPPSADPPPPATRFHLLPLKPTFAKGKPGGFVYFIRT